MPYLVDVFALLERGIADRDWDLELLESRSGLTFLRSSSLPLSWIPSISCTSDGDYCVFRYNGGESPYPSGDVGDLARRLAILNDVFYN